MTDPQELIDRLMAIVEARVVVLEKKTKFTDFDCRNIAELLKILMAAKKEDTDIEAEMSKLIASLPTDQLRALQ